MIDKSIKEFAIPLLPANSINEALEFYKALGFEITYQQKQPNNYIAVKLRELEIHFFALKALEPQNNFSTCYLIVNSIDEMYESFKQGLKSKYGKVPTKGFPRINPLKDMPTYGVRQFVVVDPSGNYIRIGQPIPQQDSLIFTENNVNKDSASSGTELEKVYELGSRLLDGKNDYKTAGTMIDNALKNIKNPDSLELFKVLILRLRVAVNEEENNLANQLVQQIDKLLVDIDQNLIKDDLRLFNELKEEISN